METAGKLARLVQVQAGRRILLHIANTQQQHLGIGFWLSGKVGTHLLPRWKKLQSRQISVNNSAEGIGVRMAAYKLVLIRHGESCWNQENRFCGWYDADLSETGEQEAKRGGQALKGNRLRDKAGPAFWIRHFDAYVTGNVQTGTGSILRRRPGCIETRT